MAALFDAHQYFRIKVLLFILVLCSHHCLYECRKHKHAPVVAFFQGHCRYNICDQRCKDIDNGGYICDCYQGYHLNTDGISCTKIGEDTDEIHLEKPNIIKIVGSDSDTIIDTQYNTKNSDSDAKYSNSDAKNSNSKSIYSNGDHKLDNTLNVDKSDNKPSVDVTLDNTINSIIYIDDHNIGKEEHDHKYQDINSVDHAEEHEIKIVTFDQKPESLTLETDNLRTSETLGNENLQNLVPDLLPPSYSSSNEIEKVDKVETTSDVPSTGTGVKCDEFSCLNNGNCVDDGSVYRNKLRCNCELGTFGEKCEHIVDVRYPRFYGNSYLALPVLKNGYKEIDLQLEFKPTAQYGLLLFSSEFEDARSDFISVAIIDGLIEFRYDCGTGMAILRSESTVVMETWNILRIYRYENIASIWLNQDQPVNGTSPGSYSRLTLRLNLYIGGYDKIESIGDKVGTSKGFVGCVQEVKVNGYRYDLRKSDIVGDAQFGSNIGECSEGLCDNVLCQNGGQCKVISADSHICLCPLGTVGESCQHVDDVHIPEFNQHSYLEYKGLGRTALLFLEIELVVKATKPDGLILYNGYTLDRSGDFISLALHDSYIEYRFDLGTGPAIIRSPERITLNKWHWIKISRTGMEGILEIDDRTVAIGQSQGAFTQLTVTQNLYIGGHRNFDETSKQANVTYAFEGCIQKLTMNNKVIRLIQDAISGINVDSCEHACIGEPCLHQGQCVPKKDIYTCYCPLGYSGKNCQKDVDRNMLNPRFTSESFLMYSQKNIAKRIGGDTLDVQLSIKPQSTNGLLLWSGPNVIQATSDYISIGIKDGIIQFRYNLGSGDAIIISNVTNLYDGLWHNIHVKRDKQIGYLTVDGNTVTGQSKGSYTMLNTNKILYIGGMTDVFHDTLHKYTTGYSGCMKDVIFDEDFMLNLLESADNGRNIIPCS